MNRKVKNELVFDNEDKRQHLMSNFNKANREKLQRQQAEKQKEKIAKLQQKKEKIKNQKKKYLEFKKQFDMIKE